MPSVCAICAVQISADADVFGFCGPCSKKQVQEGVEWAQFMLDRFRPHKPLKDEMFKVELVVKQCGDGRWLACRWVGSTLVKPRCAGARKFDTEQEACDSLADWAS